MCAIRGILKTMSSQTQLQMIVPTAFIAPAAEFLIQIEGRGAIATLGIRQPFRNNIQEPCVQSNSSPDQGDNNPRLSGIVRVP